MAEQRELSNAAYFTNGLKGPFRKAGETVHDVMAPLGEGLERALYGMPLLGPMLAVLVKGLLNAAEGVVGLGILAVGGPLGKVWDMLPWNLEETELADKEPAKPGIDAVKEVGKADEKGAVKEPGKEAGKGDPDLEIVPDQAVQNQSAADDRVKLSVPPQREVQVREGKTIFRKNPQDVYSAGEDEPQMKKMVGILEQTQQKVAEIRHELEENRKNNTPNWRDKVPYEELAEYMYTRMIDHDMRKGRQAAGAPGALEQHIREKANNEIQMEHLLKPSAYEKNLVEVILRQMSQEQLMDITEGMDSLAFRNFRQEMGQDIKRNRKHVADQPQLEQKKPLEKRQDQLTNLEKDRIQAIL